MKRYKNITTINIYNFEVLTGRGAGTKYRIAASNKRNGLKIATDKLESLLVDFNYMEPGQPLVYDTDPEDLIEKFTGWIVVKYAGCYGGCYA